MVRIIKASEHAHARAGEAGGADFVDVAHQLQTQMNQARQQATAIIQTARRESQQIRRDAELQGRQQAEQFFQQRVRGEVERRLASVLPALEQAVDQLDAARDAHLKQWETGVVQLASAMAARLVRRELRALPHLPVDLIREALQLAAGAHRIKVRLSPEDYQTLGAEATQLARSANGGAEVIADPEVSSGGCIVQSEFGTIDQRFEAQLARIVEELI